MCCREAFGDNGLDFFVCGDQLLRGAALNAVCPGRLSGGKLLRSSGCAQGVVGIPYGFARVGGVHRCRLLRVGIPGHQGLIQREFLKGSRLWTPGVNLRCSSEVSLRLLHGPSARARFSSRKKRSRFLRRRRAALGEATDGPGAFLANVCCDPDQGLKH